MQIRQTRLDMRADALRFRRALTRATLFAGLVWVIFLVGEALELRLFRFGIIPRSPQGLLGIFLAPLLHGSMGHIISNTLPLVWLGTMMRYMYPAAAKIALPIIWIGSGLLVWVIGRDSSHIGASGVVYGMMFFLFTAGLMRSDVRSLALAMLVFFFYGGMIWGMFPGEPGVSFEAHVAGAAIGLMLALVLRVLDPPLAPKKYWYEFEEELEREARARGEFWPDPLDGEWRNDLEVRLDEYGNVLPPPPSDDGLTDDGPPEERLTLRQVVNWILSKTRRR